MRRDAVLKPKPDPLKDLLAIQEQINKLFEDRLQQGIDIAVPQTPSTRSGAWTPPADAWETADRFALRLELPGLDPSDVTVAVEGGNLTVRGERKKPAATGVRSFHRMEREYGTFVRAFTLPKGMASFVVESAWDDGVLQVTVSKTQIKPSSTKKK